MRQVLKEEEMGEGGSQEIAFAKPALKSAAALENILAGPQEVKCRVTISNSFLEKE